jgi:hypothetical protein
MLQFCKAPHLIVHADRGIHIGFRSSFEDRFQSAHELLLDTVLLRLVCRGARQFRTFLLSDTARVEALELHALFRSALSP